MNKKVHIDCRKPEVLGRVLKELYIAEVTDTVSPTAYKEKNRIRLKFDVEGDEEKIKAFVKNLSMYTSIIRYVRITDC